MIRKLKLLATWNLHKRQQKQLGKLQVENLLPSVMVELHQNLWTTKTKTFRLRYFWKYVSYHPDTLFLQKTSWAISCHQQGHRFQTLVLVAASRDEPVIQPGYKLPSNLSRWSTQEREDTFICVPDHRLSTRSQLCLSEALLWVRSSVEENVVKKTQIK